MYLPAASKYSACERSKSSCWPWRYHMALPGPALRPMSSRQWNVELMRPLMSSTSASRSGLVATDEHLDVAGAKVDDACPCQAAQVGGLHAPAFRRAGRPSKAAAILGGDRQRHTASATINSQPPCRPAGSPSVAPASSPRASCRLQQTLCGASTKSGGAAIHSCVQKSLPSRGDPSCVETYNRLLGRRFYYGGRFR